MNFSYNISQNIKDQLAKIEELRARILLTPLSPETELRLKWEATANRIFWGLNLNNNPLTKSEILKLLVSLPKRKLRREEQEAIKYKKGLDYINHEWMVSDRNVTSKSLLTLFEAASLGRLRTSENNLRQLLDYLQAGGPEHPVVASGVGLSQIQNLSPFTEGNAPLSFLTGYLFLCKGGYDFRGMFVIEEYFKRDFSEYQRMSQIASQSGNLTLWLEYFANAVIHQLTRVLEDIRGEKFRTDLPKSSFELNDRQKEILTILEQPETSISNQKVQKLFKISQITASRDLGKLASLGLLFPHGKGRSVYYTRI